MLLSRSTRTYDEQVIASIIDDSRCGMSAVSFRTAPAIGGLSCFKGFVHPTLPAEAVKLASDRSFRRRAQSRMPG